MKLQNLLQKFISSARESAQITVYNKAGIQHELAVFLQQQLADDEYGVQVAREVGAVVLGTKGTALSKEVIDVYVYQVAGAEQFCVQVCVLGEEKDAAVELEQQIRLLDELKESTLTEICLLLVRNAQVHEPGMLNSYSLDWQELQPKSQDSNGPWLCTVISV